MFAPTASTSPAHRLFAVAARGTWAVATGINRYVRAYLNRRVAMTMLEFDERMLKDIGVTRGDVHASIVSPPSIDPTVRLRILAVERRASARATAAERREIERQLTERQLTERLVADQRAAREAC